MKEYRIFEWDLLTDEGYVRPYSETEKQLNNLAKEGWYVVCQLEGPVDGFLLVRNIGNASG